MAIRYKLILILLGLIILPMLLGMGILFGYVRVVIKDARVLQLENIVNLEKARVEEYFKERKEDIQLFQTSPAVKDYLPVAIKFQSGKNSPQYINAKKQLEERLEAVQKAYGYSDVMLADPSGKIIFVSSEVHKEQLGKPLSNIDRKAFENGRKGVYFSDIYKRRVGGKEDFGILCTAPLHDRSGNFIGVAVFEISAGQVFELVREATGLGKTGDTYINIPRGDEIFFISPNRLENNKVIKIKDILNSNIAIPMQYALKGKDGAKETTDYKGNKVLAAWRFVPSVGWGLVAKIDSDEAFAPIVRLREISYAAEALVIIFCAAAAFLLSKSIVVPILTLQHGMKVIGSGNLDYKVGTNAKDEIGQLSRDFDRMAENLGKVTASRNELELEVSERKRAEEAVRLAGVYNRSLIEASLDPLVTIGPDGKITDVNAATEAVTGYTRDGLIGTDFTDYFTDPEDAGAGYQKVFREGMVRDYPLEIKHEDGRIMPVLYNASVYKDEAGEVIGVFAAARDITERKRTDDILRASLRLSEFALNHSLDELLTGVLDQAESLTGSHIGFFHFLEPDQKTLRLQTWSTNTLKNMCTAEGKGAHYPVDKAGVWVEAIKERRPLVHNDYNSLSGRKGLPQGHAPVIRELVFPIIRSGQITAVIGVGNKAEEYLEHDVDTVSQIANRAWDIILAKRAEEKVRKLNEDLEIRVVERTAELTAVNRELEAFTYSVSHDLRAPLRHIHGFVDLLLQNSSRDLDEKGQRYLTTISKAASQMGNLVDDLLAFSRMGRTEIKKSQIDLDRLVHDVINEFKGDLEGRNAEWKVGKLPSVHGDPSMIRLVMVNLIANAVKFTRKKDKTVIEIGPLMDGPGEVVIFVKDNGVGFDMAYIDKLFGVFQRLHSQEEFEGTGIGLANVRRIISRHGGRTWAEGEIGQGASFYFSLPAVRRENI